MPNWCSNYLIVTGESIVNFDNQFKKENYIYEQLFITDPQKIPQEEEFIKDPNNPNVIYIKRLNREYSFENFLPCPENEIVNWYNWRCKNWGTKWDLCEMEAEIFEDVCYYRFYTAWTPPLPVIETMSKAYPDLTITLLYDEPGMCFAGKVVVRNSEHIEKYETYGLHEYKRFLREEFGLEFIGECKDCTYLLEEAEILDVKKCPICSSLNIDFFN